MIMSDTHVYAVDSISSVAVKVAAMPLNQAVGFA